VSTLSVARVLFSLTHSIDPLDRENLMSCCAEAQLTRDVAINEFLIWNRFIIKASSPS
jgi:hypothetical protein